jgi:L-rhamnose-H+ transport protein
MDTSPFLGIGLYVLAGLSGACFYLPLQRVKQWSWESFWMVYAVAGLILVPWGLAAVVSPNVLEVLRHTSWSTLGWCYLFGAMWGVGGLTWGLMIRYLGVGLGLAVGCGLCASAGTLIPPAVGGTLPALAEAPWGIATLVGVGIALLGIIATGAAGMSKERELSAEQKKAVVAEFDFRKGILVAIFSGITSAGMAFGLGAGHEIEQAALKTQPYTPELWKGIPVLVVVLLGGFTINFLWCVYLNVKNRSGGDYLKAGAPLLANVLLAALAGAVWCSQFALYKVADAKSADLSFAGWTVLMTSMIVFSTLLGIFLGEWRGVSGRTRSLLAGSLVLLVAALVSIGYGNYLKPDVTNGVLVKADAAALVVHTTDDADKTIPLGGKHIVLDGNRAAVADVTVPRKVTISRSNTTPSTIEIQTWPGGKTK